MDVSVSTTFLVRNEAPTVEVVFAKAFFTYRWTRLVLPTPWLGVSVLRKSRYLHGVGTCEPSTTTFASTSEPAISKSYSVRCARGKEVVEPEQEVGRGCLLIGRPVC